MSPGLALGALLVLIGAQLAWLMAAARRRYWWLLLLAVAGFVGGELFAIATHLGGPLLGGLHPVADAAGIAVAELAGAVMGPERRAP